MSYDIVFANGCSFVQGSEVNGEALPSIPVKNVPNRFSKLLANHYNAEEVNIAAGGSGNVRIFRTTFNWLEENIDSLQSKKILFILGLSHPQRNELYSIESGKYVKFSPHANPFLVYDDLTNEATTAEDVQIFHNVYWTNFYKYEQKIKEHYSLIKVLKTYILTICPKADIFIFSSLGLYPKWFINNLDLKFPFPSEYHSWAPYCANNGLYDKGTHHPNKQAHKQVAEFIIKHYDIHSHNSSVQN